MDSESDVKKAAKKLSEAIELLFKIDGNDKVDAIVDGLDDYLLELCSLLIDGEEFYKKITD